VLELVHRTFTMIVIAVELPTSPTERDEVLLVLVAILAFVRIGHTVEVLHGRAARIDEARIDELARDEAHRLALLVVPHVGVGGPSIRLEVQDARLEDPLGAIGFAQIGRVGEGLDENGAHRKSERPLARITDRRPLRHVHEPALLRVIAEERRDHVEGQHTLGRRLLRRVGEEVPLREGLPGRPRLGRCDEHRGGLGLGLGIVARAGTRQGCSEQGREAER
jgi:hypothetical protein